MNIWDVILSLAVLLAVILAAVHCVRARKRGGSCCGDCAHCASSCTERRKS